METQKVINTLESYKNKIIRSPNHNDYWDVVDNLESAIYALNKQVPAKLSCMFNPRNDVVLYSCPICGKAPTFTSKGELAGKYCSRCGQRLEWDSKDWEEDIVNERGGSY